MSFRRALSILTLLLVVGMLFTLRNELVAAWHLLGQVNVWILLLIIPLQFLSYYAGGAAIFSYLKQRGQTENVSPWDMTRMALELNFVNHVLPTAGLSGVSYMTWRLGKLGVSSGRATLAQVVRFAASFGSFALLLVIAVVLVTLDSGVNRITILATSALTSGLIISGMVIWYIIDSPSRLRAFSGWVSYAINLLGRKVLRRKRDVLSEEKVRKFLEELHDDYLALKSDPKLLIRPFGWGILFNLTEVSLYFLTFLALGEFVNPATILLAIGVAAVAGSFIPTPGGTGGYEAFMVLILTTSGVDGATAIAGVLLARIILVLLTIGSGYIFYHLALQKYGKHPTQR